MMRTVSIIVAREYLQRVRTRGFVIGTIAAPILLLALLIIPGLMGARSVMAELELGLVDHTGEMADDLTSRLEGGGYSVEIAGSPGEIEAMLTRAASGELGGVLVLDAASLERGAATYVGEHSPSALRGFLIQQAVAQVALERRLGTADDPAVAELLRGGSLTVDLVGEDSRDDDARIAGYAVGFGGAFFLYFVLMIYGSMVLRSVLEEKTGRIAEVILSSVRPWQLMLGKVVGVGAVGLTQIMVWVVSAALILSFGVPAALPFLPDSEVLGELPGMIPSAWVMVHFVISFVMGYFIYSSLFAAVGAMCSSDEEAQQAQLPVIMLVVVPFVFMMPVLDDPGSTFAVLMSHFPFFTPILMFGRVAVGGAPLWEVLLSIASMVLALLAVAWVAGRIYRVGILMQGKRPTFPELWRWVRQA